MFLFYYHALGVAQTNLLLRYRKMRVQIRNRVSQLLRSNAEAAESIFKYVEHVHDFLVFLGAFT